MKPFSVTGYLSDFISLFYPLICAACDNDLRQGEDVVCTRCRYLLPRTGYVLQSGHPLERLFMGRARVEAATALFHFAKGSGVQRMVHGLKYHGRQDIGIAIGRMLAERWKQFPSRHHPDVVIPVPLHRRRLQQRGYNQAEAVALGFSQASGTVHLPDALVRIVESSTQTLKLRYERHSSMDGIFKVNRSEELSGKKVLLVDDVITTGATLIACAEALAEVPGMALMVGAIAVARR